MKSLVILALTAANALGQAPTHAGWLEFGLGASHVAGTGSGAAGNLGYVYSHRNWLFIARADGITVQATDPSDRTDIYSGTGLIGRRSSGHRAFWSLSGGLAKVDRQFAIGPCRTCERAGHFRTTAIVVEAAGRANIWVPGGGLRLTGTLGDRATSIAFTVSSGIGWWGR
jgi:hypothetical protein